MPIEQIATRNEDGSFENLFPLPIDKGGTGATTKEQALINLGTMPLADMNYSLKYIRYAPDLGNQLPKVQSGGLSIQPYDLFIEFYEIEGTNIRGINRLNITLVYDGPQNGVSAGNTTIIPAGTIPEKYRIPDNVGDASLDYAVVGALVPAGAVVPNTQETASFFNLRFWADGSVTMIQPLRKWANVPLHLYGVGNMQAIPQKWGKA